MSQEIYEVNAPVNIKNNASARISVPGSKSITNRALLIAAMAKGTSLLRGCLTSDDAVHFLECLKTLGFPVREESFGELGRNIEITGFGGSIPNKKAEIYVGSAGTAARFLAAMLAFSDGEYTMLSSEQMKKRPMQPLIDALRTAGARVECLEEEGHFPLHIIGVSDRNDIPSEITVNIDKSSQFLSALLIAAGALDKDTVIKAEGTHGLGYVELTAEMMKSFGVSAEKRISENGISYFISAGEKYHSLEYDIEPDMSAAAYFYALAAILGIRVTVNGVRSGMLQGDTAFIELLERMGCTVERGEEVTVSGSKALKGGFTASMSAFSDQALTLAAIAPFADAPITITGIGHIRLQECDRINAICRNLEAIGIKTRETADSVTIFPGIPHGGEIETFDDHRVAMSFALTGLRVNGIKIINPSCCRKTFAEYFEVLERVIAQITG